MSVGKKASKSKLIRHNEFRYHRRHRQEMIASEIREKNKIYQENDFDLFKQGSLWFKCGMNLEDANEDLRNNINFVNGFNRAKRLACVDTQLYNLGIDFFNKGITLEQIPEHYKNNDYFLNGYNDAKKNSLIKKLNMNGICNKKM